MIAGTASGGLEDQVTWSVQTHYSHLHILCIHYVTALTDGGDSLMGVDEECLQGGGDRPALAEAAASVRRYRELDAIGDADLPCVANLMTAGSVPRVQRMCGGGYTDEHS
uniref:Uncharacterized protein n=1 Tax=Clastoptera arizonana TaxID=38151 RepID=A0A1B6C7V2_9HEMI